MTVLAAKRETLDVADPVGSVSLGGAIQRLARHPCADPGTKGRMKALEP